MNYPISQDQSNDQTFPYFESPIIESCPATKLKNNERKHQITQLKVFKLNKGK